MNIINKNNYESFFLDYHEGRLSPELTFVVLSFLEQHPELNDEFHSFEIISIAEESFAHLSSKDFLKKGNLNEKNFQEFMIGRLEGDLSEKDKTDLTQFIKQHPPFAEEEQLYQKTILHPDLRITYEPKNQLKKTIPINQLPWWTFAAAAAIALLAGIIFFFPKSENHALQQPDLSVTQSKPEKIRSSATKSIGIALKSNEIEKKTDPKQTSSFVNRMAPIPALKHSLINFANDSSFPNEHLQILPMLPAVFVETLVLTEAPLTSIQYTSPEPLVQISPVYDQVEYLSATQFLGHFIKKNTGRVLAKLKSGDLTEDVYDSKNNSDLFTLAQTGTQAINMLTGQDFRISKTTDPSGNIEFYSFNAGTIGFSTSRDK